MWIAKLETTPVPGYTGMSPNCVQYKCDAGFPVIWCTHTEPTYQNTNHGWPSFAAKLTWDEFSKY